MKKSKLVFKKGTNEIFKIEQKNISSQKAYKEYKQYIQKEISLQFKYIAVGGIIIVLLGLAVMFREEFERFKYINN